jgi:Tfp pilus assembly protein FimT
MFKPVHSLRTLRGFTLMSLLFWSIVVAVAAILIMKIAPTINEYLTIQKAVVKIAREATSVQEVRTAFEKQKQIEYSISTIGGADLVVTKENEKLVVSFAYDKEIELFGPIFLLIKYKGQSN